MRKQKDFKFVILCQDWGVSAAQREKEFLLIKNFGD